MDLIKLSIYVIHNSTKMTSSITKPELMRIAVSNLRRYAVIVLDTFNFLSDILYMSGMFYWRKLRSEAKTLALMRFGTVLISETHTI